VIVVGDSSVLIALERIDAQELLPRLYREVHVPEAVWREVFSSDTAIAPAWLIRHSAPARPSPLEWTERLDAGEIEAIQLCPGNAR
jgi:predicted nucleic acid-binding protein